MQAARDAGTLERPGSAIFGAHRHQAGHFILGHGNLLPPPGGEGKVFNHVVMGSHGEISV